MWCKLHYAGLKFNVKIKILETSNKSKSKNYLSVKTQTFISIICAFFKLSSMNNLYQFTPEVNLNYGNYAN